VGRLALNSQSFEVLPQFGRGSSATLKQSVIEILAVVNTRIAKNKRRIGSDSALRALVTKLPRSSPAPQGTVAGQPGWRRGLPS
jgi:hypothetical protein